MRSAVLPTSAIVTGGAGFIGSHLVDRLLAEKKVVMVIDNLSSGLADNLRDHMSDSRVRFLKRDLKQGLGRRVAGYDYIFHFAANPDVRSGASNPGAHFDENILATYRLLEAVRKYGEITNFVFASTSTVYGDAVRIPTPENYGPLLPVSAYGGSKLACEGLVSAYAHTYGFKAIIYRFANIIGGRSNHGVIPDFVEKLARNPKKLEILGDGRQSKSYLHVVDCMDGILSGLSTKTRQVEVFNVGSYDRIEVTSIAEIVCEEMGLKDVKFVYNTTTKDGSGWTGDVKLMGLDVARLESLGWTPRLGTREAVRRAVREYTRLYKAPPV